MTNDNNKTKTIQWTPKCNDALVMNIMSHILKHSNNSTYVKIYLWKQNNKKTTAKSRKKSTLADRNETKSYIAWHKWSEFKWFYATTKKKWNQPLQLLQIIIFEEYTNKQFVG